MAEDSQFEREHPRGQPDNAGQFVKKGGGSARSKDNKEKIKDATRIFSDDPTRDIAEYGGLERKSRKTIKLPNQEYAEFCSAIRTRYADKIPQKGQMLYGDNYYQFKFNPKSEQLFCTYKLPIYGNEQIISEWTKIWK